LAEHTLKSVIQSAVFDEGLCLTELRPEGSSIAAVEMRLDVIEVDRWDSGKDISEIRLPAAMEFRGDEDFPVSCSCGRRPGPARNRRFSTVVTQIVERPFRPGLPTAKSIHQDVDADRVGESVGSFKDVYFPIVDGLFRWNVELGCPFETACFEECHDVVVVIRGDDEIQVG
jgi:hypothetical protein